jgi:hypothetical protein
MLAGLVHAIEPIDALFEVVAGLLGPIWALALEEMKKQAIKKRCESFTGLRGLGGVNE